MFHIILIILKTIGILLLSILGILLTLVFIVLFVPIRYQVVAKKYDDIQANAKIRWLASILYFKLIYEKKKISYQLRLFGFIIKDSNKPKRNRHKIKSTHKKKHKNSRPKTNKTNKTTYTKPTKKKNNVLESTLEGSRISENETILPNQMQHKNAADDITQVKNDGEDNLKDYQKNNLIEDKKLSFWDKLCNKVKLFFHKIKLLFIKIKNFLINMKPKFLKLKLTKDTMIRRFTLVKTFLTMDTNKEGLKKVWWSIKRITKHIYPKRVRANIHFGTGDPCSTGQALGFISLTYHLYGKSVKIVPDFYEEVFEGNLYAKGRIRIFTLLIICIKLLLDKNFKQLIKSYQELKEEL